MLYIAAKLAEMKEKPRLSFATLNETVRMQQFLNDTGFSRAHVVRGRVRIVTGAIVGCRRVAVGKCVTGVTGRRAERVAAVEYVVAVERERSDGKARGCSRRRRIRRTVAAATAAAAAERARRRLVQQVVVAAVRIRTETVRLRRFAVARYCHWLKVQNR